MKKLNRILLSVCCLLVIMLLSACSDKDEPITDGKVWQTYKVAVVLPMDGGLDIHWKRTLDLAAVNLKTAFANQAKGIKLEYEYHDENSNDITSLATELASREDIIAVIGGLYSSSADIMAPIFGKKKKTFFTLATTEELVRAHAANGHLWAMTETDITQCEVLLSKAKYYGAKSVALIANGEDSYGKTFIDWFAFQAKELLLDVKGIYPYKAGDLAQCSAQAAASGADYVICVPSEIEDITPMLKAVNSQAEKTGTAPKTLFSDTAFGADVIEKTGITAEGLEGVTFGANPESGFEISYKVFFNDDTTLGEAQLYDAAMLIGYGVWYNILHNKSDLNAALRQVVDGRDRSMGSWMAEDMQLVIDAMAKGGCPDVRGASGSLDFDSKVYTNVLSTTYYNYKIYNGKYIIIDYNSSDGGKRTDATLAGWNWKVQQMQKLDGNQSDIAYSTLNEKWALIVASSTKWKNYRHQADALAMYQLLKSKGYDDEHIVFVMEDDIAKNSKNPIPGNIQVSIGGENLYHDVKIDYHVRDLKPNDIQAILLGQSSERLPKVINATENDNILVFWSGHGQYGELCWGDEYTGFTHNMAKSLFEQMNIEKRYRKMLWLVETCYSGSVLKACVGIPGILAMTAANDMETSKADTFNEDLGVWMTNRFTFTLRDEISQNIDVSLQKLYYKLFINTVGSHVMIYNNANYGNVFINGMEEFL